MGYVPSIEELESWGSDVAIPSIVELDKPQKPKAKKPKAPCKYGPRDLQGYCPKKPSASSAPIAKTGSTSRSKGSPPPLDLTKLASKIAEGSAKAAAQTVVRQVIPKISPSKKERAALIRGGVSIGKEAVAKAAGTLTGFGAALAALPAASVAAVSAAGISAFLGTQYLRNLWDKHRANRLNDKATRDRNARILWNDAIRELERREKRESTYDERIALYNLFFEDKKT